MAFYNLLIFVFSELILALMIKKLINDTKYLLRKMREREREREREFEGPQWFLWVAKWIIQWGPSPSSWC